MYPQKFSQSILSCKHNLKTVAEGIRKGFLTSHTIILIRQRLNGIGTLKSTNRRFHQLLRNGNLYKLLKSIPKSSTKQDQSILKIWAHHCECVFAQRLRRCQQMFCIYTKWWEEKALRDFIRRMRQSLVRKGKELTLGAIGVSLYNWEENRISVDDIKQHSYEFEYIDKLKANTMCGPCDKTNKNDCCTSPTEKVYEEWTPYIESEELVVWRKPHPSGHFEYKVYGCYDDICAMDFLQVQIDMDYRKKWDPRTVIVELIESDNAPNSNSDLIYWELEWPTLFANRDYVYKRRYLIDSDSNMLFIMNKSTEYPSCPAKKDKFRVEDYWSRMVIRPRNGVNFKELGVEFSLTYFDNPGSNIPGSVMTWVTSKAMPEFLHRMRDATRNYRNYCKTEGTSEYCRQLVEEERAAAEKAQKEKLDYCSFVRLAGNIRLNVQSWKKVSRGSDGSMPEISPGNMKSNHNSNRLNVEDIVEKKSVVNPAFGKTEISSNLISERYKYSRYWAYVSSAVLLTLIIYVRM